MPSACSQRKQAEQENTMIPQHRRYPYSPIVERKDYSWPDGKRLAF